MAPWPRRRWRTSSPAAEEAIVILYHLPKAKGHLHLIEKRTGIVSPGKVIAQFQGFVERGFGLINFV